jgi:hypothetical protein
MQGRAFSFSWWQAVDFLGFDYLRRYALGRDETENDHEEAEMDEENH